MFRICVMYANEDGAQFDFDYYRDTHMVMVKEHLGPHGLLKTGIEKGVSGEAGAKAPYICIGSLYFDSADQYEKGVAAIGTVLRDDIPKFTNVTPIRQVSEVVD